MSEFVNECWTNAFIEDLCSKKKTCLSYILHFTFYFTDKSLAKGNFHSRLKEALIIPRHKKEENDVLANHSHISLLNSLGKPQKSYFLVATKKGM